MLLFIVQNIILIFLGLTSGIAVSGGIFALISTIKLLTRIMGRLRLSKYWYTVEIIVAFGGLAGAVMTVFPVRIPVFYPGMIFFGLFAGIFIGCFAMALAETLNVIPILFKRAKLNKGLPIIILMIAIGKLVGSFMQLVIWRG